MYLHEKTDLKNKNEIALHFNVAIFDQVSELIETFLFFFRFAVTKTCNVSKLNYHGNYSVFAISNLINDNDNNNNNTKLIVHLIGSCVCSFVCVIK